MASYLGMKWVSHLRTMILLGLPGKIGCGISCLSLLRDKLMPYLEYDDDTVSVLVDLTAGQAH